VTGTRSFRELRTRLPWQESESHHCLPAGAACKCFNEAEEAYTRGRQKAEDLGSGWSQPLWHFYNAPLLIARGRLDEAVADAEAGIRVSEQLTALGLCVPLFGMLARIAVVRG